jgi:hypothetical protein
LTVYLEWSSEQEARVKAQLHYKGKGNTWWVKVGGVGGGLGVLGPFEYRDAYALKYHLLQFTAKEIVEYQQVYSIKQQQATPEGTHSV